MSDSLQEASSMANTSVMDKLIFTGREHVKASKTTFFRHGKLVRSIAWVHYRFKRKLPLDY